MNKSIPSSVASEGANQEGGGGDNYSIINLVPWVGSLLVLVLRFTFTAFVRFSLRFISVVGEVWLIGTYLFLSIFRRLGRMVFLTPLILTAFVYHAISFIFSFVFGIGFLVKNFLLCIWRILIFIVKFPRRLPLYLKLFIVSFVRLLNPRYVAAAAKTATAYVVNKIRFVIHYVIAKPRIFKAFVSSSVSQLYSSRVVRYRSARSRYAWQLAITGVVLSFSIGVFSYYGMAFFADLPNPFAIRDVRIVSSTRILDRNGRILYNVYKNENRTFVPLKDLPLYVMQATIAIEDADFFRHNGISFRGIFRAAYANLTDSTDRRVQGGSTITQQLVKNIFLSPEKTIERKFKEVILALFMEAYLTKEEILQMYLNEVAYGGTSYGIEEAAKYYFGKPARYLTLSEASLLAGLPTQPSANSPFVDPEAAKVRQKLVLRRMVENRFITKQQADTALNEKLVFVPRATNIQAPHFVMMVRDALVDKFGKDVVEEGGLQVYTTLDLSVQNMAEQAVRENIAKIKNNYRVGNGAALITAPQTGEILALVGSVDYFDTSIKGNVNVVTSLRQPGSSIKPVNYAYAFEHGWSPGSVIDDTPVVYRIVGSRPYAPVNYDSTFKGRMTLRSALAQSRNIPAVKLLEKNGVSNMVKMGKKLGITTWNQPERYGLALTLGAAEVRMLDMATVFGSFANLGVRKDPVLIRKVVNARGQVLVDNVKNTNFFRGLIGPAYASENVVGWQKGVRVLSKTAAYWLIDILSDNRARMPAFGPFARLEIPKHHVAVKTGTTNDFRDNWTIGFTPDYLVAAWVGNTDNTPMNSNLVSGITGAAPIWNDIMTNLIRKLPDRVWEPPSEMVPVQICAVNGLLNCPYCPKTVTEYFTPDTIPTKACNFRSPNDCAKLKAQAESEHKSQDEIKALLANCISSTTPAP